jgi:hypothetical protein
LSQSSVELVPGVVGLGAGIDAVTGDAVSPTRSSVPSIALAPDSTSARSCACVDPPSGLAPAGRRLHRDEQTAATRAVARVTGNPLDIVPRGTTIGDRL